MLIDCWHQSSLKLNLNCQAMDLHPLISVNFDVKHCQAIELQRCTTRNACYHSNPRERISRGFPSPFQRPCFCLRVRFVGSQWCRSCNPSLWHSPLVSDQMSSAFSGNVISISSWCSCKHCNPSVLSVNHRLSAKLSAHGQLRSLQRAPIIRQREKPPGMAACYITILINHC